VTPNEFGRIKAKHLCMHQRVCVRRVSKGIKYARRIFAMVLLHKVRPPGVHLDEISRVIGSLIQVYEAKLPPLDGQNGDCSFSDEGNHVKELHAC